jgi:hypothetical protein
VCRGQWGDWTDKAEGWQAGWWRAQGPGATDFPAVVSAVDASRQMRGCEVSLHVH